MRAWRLTGVVPGLADAEVQERVRAAVVHRLGPQVGIDVLQGPRPGGSELDSEVGVVQERLDDLGTQCIHDVDLAGLQAGQARLDLGPHQDRQVFVVGVMRHPDGVVDREEVVLEALEDEVLVVRVADEAVGARADRRGSTARSPRRSVSTCEKIATSPIPAKLTMKKPASGTAISNDQVRSSTASFRTQDSAPRLGLLGRQPPG